MKRILIYILLFLPQLITGQVQTSVDTIKIEEIVIRQTSLENAISGFRNKKIDTSAIKDYSLENLAEVLSGSSTLFIKSYGPGSSSTVSFRGTGATHTQLLWNELSLNSSMLGQADLSLIPAGFLDEIRIYQGGASMILGNGGLGGIVNVETKPDWNYGTSLSFNSGAGSFGTYSGVLKVRTGNEKFQSVTRAYFHTADNDYTYLNTIDNPEPVVEQRLNAGINQKSVMQELHFRGKKNVTSASFWYNNTDRNIPSNLLMPQKEGTEKQYDESFRAVIKHNIYLDKTGIEAVMAWFSDRLNYVNIPASIDSKNIMNSLFIKAAGEAAIGKKTSFRLAMNNEIDFVNSVNYAGNTNRYLTTFTASVRRVEGNRLGYVFLIREILDNFKPLVPDFSAGMDLNVLNKNEGFIRINLSRNSKIPTMNDRYWNPGGNPDLKNEYNYTGEISFDMKGNFSERAGFNAELTTYAGRISDLIQWLPGQSGYWSPQNISESGTHGFETDMGLVYGFTHGYLRINTLYAFTRAYYLENESIDSKKQIAYVPENQFSLGIKAGFRNSYAGINTCYTGKRYTTIENDTSLPGYTLTSLQAGYKIKAGISSFDLNFKAENIFGVNYEVIAYYPMPGRSFLLSLTYQFAR